MTGDNHDRDRMVLRIENEGGSKYGHLSFAIKDLKELNDRVVDFEPSVAAYWARRDGQR